MATGLKFGDLILCRYSNFHHDPTPLVFCLYSDSAYTHGLNSHYLSPAECIQLRKLLSYVPPGRTQFVYDFIKARFNSVLRAYRRYKTPLIFEIKKWQAVSLKDDETQQTVDKIFGGHTPPPTKVLPSKIVTASDRALLTQLTKVLNTLNKKRKRTK